MYKIYVNELFIVYIRIASLFYIGGHMKFDNEQLLKYIGACTSPYHTVDTSLQMLLDSGFYRS